MDMTTARAYLNREVTYWSDDTATYCTGQLIEIHSDTGEVVVQDKDGIELTIPIGSLHEGTPDEIANEELIDPTDDETVDALGIGDEDLDDDLEM